jgi:catechol 2,3-dioxygenase-like lactoylglutathione lyase family enzyme
VTWASNLSGVTLVQERLDEAKIFYSDVFGLRALHEDESNVVFKIGGTIVHLLDVAAAPDLVGPGAVAAPSSGHRVQLTIQVDDGLCRQLAQRGVRILSGPMDRLWGIRTANFEDPGGHYWELWTDLP